MQMLWSQFVPNMPTRHPRTLNSTSSSPSRLWFTSFTGHSLPLICQPTSEDIKLRIIIRFVVPVVDRECLVDLRSCDSGTQLGSIKSRKSNRAVLDTSDSHCSCFPILYLRRHASGMEIGLGERGRVCVGDGAG